MRKIYSMVIILLAILIIISNYSYAGIARSDDSSLSLGSSLDSSNDAESNSGLPESNNGGSNSIIADSKNLHPDGLIELNNDKAPKAYIILISPNPAIEYGSTYFIGWVKNPIELKVTFEWDFGDGEKYRGEGIGNPLWCNASHKFNRTGDYIINLSLIKDGRILSNDSKIIKVISLPVFGGGAGGPYYGLVGEKIVFRQTPILSTRSSIRDIQSNICSYEWDFGDGTTASGQIVSHVYDSVGIYNAKLTLTDDTGKITSYSTTVTISKITIIIHPSKISVNEKVNFGVEVIGFTPGFYSWDFGDGSFGSGQSVSHIYTEAKTYYGKLYLYNQDLISRNTPFADFVVKVERISENNNEKPVAFFTVSSIKADTSTILEFDAKASFDPDGIIVLYEWYFGDGKVIISKNEKCNYIFNKAGNWEVTCVVLDNNGDWDSYSVILNIINSNAPTAEYNNDASIFSRGSILELNNEVTTQSQPFLQDSKKNEFCNLKIFIDGVPDSLEDVDKINIKVKVTDLSGIYKANGVDVLLSSNIVGYERVSYVAQKNKNSNDYFIDIQISLLSNDISSVDLAFTASPHGDYSEIDWAENTCSESIKKDILNVNDNIIPNIINHTTYFGSLSM